MNSESRIVQIPRVEVSVSINLNEAELRALNVLTIYGTDAFIKVFYENLGKSYMQPHEDGLRSLFRIVQDNIPNILKRADAARKAFNTKDQ